MQRPADRLDSPTSALRVDVSGHRGLLRDGDRRDPVIVVRFVEREGRSPWRRFNRLSWRTRAEARLAVVDYIEAFYNPRRRHSGLGYLSPAAYERRYRIEAITAA